MKTIDFQRRLWNPWFSRFRRVSECYNFQEKILLKTIDIQFRLWNPWFPRFRRVSESHYFKRKIPLKLIDFQLRLWNPWCLKFRKMWEFDFWTTLPYLHLILTWRSVEMSNTRALLRCQDKKMQTQDNFSLVSVFVENREHGFWATLQWFCSVLICGSVKTNNTRWFLGCQDRKMQTLEHFLGGSMKLGR